MNAKTLVNNYSQLAPEERFRLILAAGARGDDVEKDRLTSAGKDITLSMPDHSPFAHAFNELAILTFIELQAEAAGYNDANERADDALHLYGLGKTEEGIEVTEAAGNRSAWVQCLEMARAAAFMLRTKTEGWKLFCERLNVPPMVLWKLLPGFDRLQRALELAEKAAFRPARMVQWMNDTRPADKSDVNEADILNIEKCANASEAAFQERARWWGA